MILDAFGLRIYRILLINMSYASCDVRIITLFLTHTLSSIRLYSLRLKISDSKMIYFYTNFNTKSITFKSLILEEKEYLL